MIVGAWRYEATESCSRAMWSQFVQRLRWLIRHVMQ